jgi:hypothetical protein
MQVFRNHLVCLHDRQTDASISSSDTTSPVQTWLETIVSATVWRGCARIYGALCSASEPLEVHNVYLCNVTIRSLTRYILRILLGMWPERFLYPQKGF